MISVVIVAGGQGQRLGMEIPKAFVALGDHPIIAYSCMVFDRYEAIDEIVIVVPQGMIPMVTEKIAPYSKKIKAIIEGGEQRWQSVRAGVAATDSGREMVLIHDAARPFVTPQVIDSLLDKKDSWQAVVTVTPEVDTIRTFENDRVLNTVDRSKVVRIGTPQLFNKAKLVSLFSHIKSHTVPPTDEAMLFERAGIPVGLAWGDPRNFKITTPGDFSIAQAIVASSEYQVLLGRN